MQSKVSSKSPKLKWPKATLQELRDRRDLAVQDGDMKLAFILAIEIDKKKNLQIILP